MNDDICQILKNDGIYKSYYGENYLEIFSDLRKVLIKHGCSLTTAKGILMDLSRDLDYFVEIKE